MPDRFNWQLNFKQLKRSDMIWLYDHKCRQHNRRYIEHPNCYMQEQPGDSPIEETIAYFDIESTGLKADYDYVLSYCLVDEDGKFYGRVVTPKEILGGIFDRELMKDLCTDLRRFHRIIGHYMERFDIPFVRTRCVKHGHDFPLYREVLVQDTWSILKYKFDLSSNRLGTACNFFGIAAKEQPLTPDIWQKARIGDRGALDYIWAHNKEDVVSTRKLYNKIRGYTIRGKRSL